MPFEKLDRPDLRVPAGRFADLCAVHHNTVSNWIRAGLPAKKEGRAMMLDLAVAFPWVRARDRKDLDEAKAATSPDVAKAAKITAEARLKEMDVAEREARLLPAEQVAERWTQRVVTLREAVMSVAGAAVQATLVHPEQEAELEALLRDALVLVAARPAEEVE